MDYNKLERHEAKKIGAVSHKNSGRGKYQKGDASLDRYVIDFKFASKTFTLNEDIWAKVVTDCLRTDNTKNPMIMLVLGSGGRKTRLAVIEWEVLEELLEELNGQHN